MNTQTYVNDIKISFFGRMEEPISSVNKEKVNLWTIMSLFLFKPFLLGQVEPTSFCTVWNFSEESILLTWCTVQDYFSFKWWSPIVMVFKATFKNISAISWRLVLLVEKTDVPKEKTTDMPQVTDKLEIWQGVWDLHPLVKQVPIHVFCFIYQKCIGKYKMQ